ncbi:MAG: hypothetical protein AAB834_03545 [Patescibacteria group bacterium]
MANFPTDFSMELLPLTEAGLSPRGQAALGGLAAGGLEVVSGIREADTLGILAIAVKEDVREFCPNDAKRFGNPERWLAKGRGAFLLRTIETEQIVGYSWVGTEPCEELPDHPTTTAFRTTVKGTGTNLVIATLEGARAVHGAEDFGLETWATNGRAVKTYVKAGAHLEYAKSEEPNKETGKLEPIMRPTLRPRAHDPIIDGKRRRYDTRLFMSFPKAA